MIYGGAGNNYLSGGAGNDHIIAGSGDNYLFGGADDDLLYGGTGNDNLYCDAGNDFLNGGAGNKVLRGDEQITLAKAACGAEQVILVGFSGGGGAAALLVARRQDVVFLGTVAGNLDTEGWADLQGVSQLAESLNTKAVAPSLQHLPQRHLSSTDDTTIPPEISERFCRAARQPQSCRVVKGVQHGGEWQEVWAIR